MEFTCRKCGKCEDTRDWMDDFGAELLESQMCQTCHFWEEKVLWKVLGGKLSDNRGVATVVRCNNNHYLVYPMVDMKTAGRQFVGHGGGLFVFKMLDGTLLASNNVWCQGPIPYKYRTLLPNNAERLLTYDEMVEQGFVKRMAPFVG